MQTGKVANVYTKRNEGKKYHSLLKYKHIYFMLLPAIVYYFVFHYLPMYGVIIAFKEYSVTKGIWESSWVGVRNFEDFFGSYYFWRIIRNTLMINVYDIIFAFPAPIILALLLNEIKKESFKRMVQTITYLPHFISVVVVSGIVLDFFSTNGIINELTSAFGVEKIFFMTEPKWFYPIYVGSGIWQNVGWSSIIYLAALTGIDTQLYDAALVDGAGRWKQLLNITLPGIFPTIIIMFILRIGNLMSVGFEKIMLLYNPSIYETADVISTFVYRKGMLDSSFSYSTAVGVFNSVISFILLVAANNMSKRFSESSLW